MLMIVQHSRKTWKHKDPAKEGRWGGKREKRGGRGSTGGGGGGENDSFSFILLMPQDCARQSLLYLHYK